MSQREYMSEPGRWRIPVTGPKGVDCHQWGNVAGEQVPVQQTSRDMRSVPRSAHIQSPEYKEPYGFQRSPTQVAHTLSPEFREPYGFQRSPIQVPHTLSPGIRDPYGWEQDIQQGPVLGLNGPAPQEGDNSTSVAMFEEESQPNLIREGLESGEQSNYTFGRETMTAQTGRPDTRRGGSSFLTRSQESPDSSGHGLNGLGGNKPAMQTNEQSNYTPRATNPQNNGSGTHGITASNLIDYLARTGDNTLKPTGAKN
ncbi:hypothetical protein FQN54_005153 [Arachnomyces sp. PD_36]|nr:hypothetical protein FQN54_005153 [Arachnomyces sp. PD_36]